MHAVTQDRRAGVELADDLPDGAGQQRRLNQI
jgi:hypothetical protein